MGYLFNALWDLWDGSTHEIGSYSALKSTKTIGDPDTINRTNDVLLRVRNVSTVTDGFIKITGLTNQLYAFEHVPTGPIL